MVLLSVKGNQIVTPHGEPVRLRGVGVGGWMNMENFINGYPGAEHGIRTALATVLGPARGRFFFDRLLDYFLAEEDLAFIRARGANVVRLPLNYRHFESDRKPFRYLEPGFERLNQVIEWCAKHDLYAILDLHAAQGWQNTGWHCDNDSRHALLWQHPHFQDRFVALWKEIARRYRGNPTVAGYNLVNEPDSGAVNGRFRDDYEPDWEAINGLYRRTVQAVRAVDPEHIIFLEGDIFSRRFRGLDPPFAENLVYSSHNYTGVGFGPGSYPGEYQGERWDRSRLKEEFLAQEGTRYAQEHNVPLWVGEFGSVYNGPAAERPDRLRALDDQIDIFEEFGCHWTVWTYKDVGVMGWVELNPESEYMQRVAPVLQAKRLLNTDFWMHWLPPTAANELIEKLAWLVEDTLGDPDLDPRAIRRYLAESTLAGYVASLMQPTWAKRFTGLSEADLDRLAASFALERCRPHRELLAVIEKHTSRPAS